MISVPARVRENASLGLALRKQYGRGGTEIGERTAKALASGKISQKLKKHISEYFPRHQGDRLKADGSDGKAPSNGYIAWMLWGGNAGRDWTMVQKKHNSPLITFPSKGMAQAFASAAKSAGHTSVMVTAYRQKPAVLLGNMSHEEAERLKAQLQGMRKNPKEAIVYEDAPYWVQLIKFGKNQTPTYEIFRNEGTHSKKVGSIGVSFGIDRVKQAIETHRERNRKNPKRTVEPWEYKTYLIAPKAYFGRPLKKAEVLKAGKITQEPLSAFSRPTGPDEYVRMVYHVHKDARRRHGYPFVVYNLGKVREMERGLPKPLAEVTAEDFDDLMKWFDDEDRKHNPYMGFKKLTSSLARKGVQSPKALAAWIGRKKYGAKAFQAMAKAGRLKASRARKRNPNEHVREHAHRILKMIGYVDDSDAVYRLLLRAVESNVVEVSDSELVQIYEAIRALGGKPLASMAEAVQYAMSANDLVGGRIPAGVAGLTMSAKRRNDVDLLGRPVDPNGRRAAEILATMGKHVEASPAKTWNYPKGYVPPAPKKKAAKKKSNPVAKDKVERFISVYLRELQSRFEWAKNAAMVEKFLGEATAALATNGKTGTLPSLKGEALKATLKQLGIKPTYKAAAEWFQE